MATNGTEKSDLVADLERAQRELEQAEQRMQEFGRSDLEELADAYESFSDLLDRYEDQVVGDAGDYETNIQFQSEIAEVVDDLPSDMLLSEAFEDCSEHLKQKYFKTSHFEYVREQLEPVADLVQRLYDYRDALQAYRETRRDVRYRVRDLEERIDDLERLNRLGNADLEAPIERLREPIQTYNDAVTEAFQRFHRERPAREVIDFLDAMDEYPLVGFESPPEQLRRYLRSEPPGTEPIPTLLEYAGYSRSKLDHYVDDPDRLKHVLGGKQTYLSRLDAAPLRIDWPAPDATTLRWRCEELTAAVNRIDPSAVPELRAVAALPRETDYARLRTSAQARTELTDAEREQIRAGSIPDDLEAARSQRDRLEAALADTPDR